MAKLTVKGTDKPIKVAIVLDGVAHVLVENHKPCTECSLWDLCDKYREDEGYPCYISDERTVIFEQKEVELIND